MIRKRILGSLFMMIFAAGCFSAGYAVIHLLPLKLPPYSLYLAATFMSFFVIFLIGVIFRFFNRPRQRHFYMEIIHALRKIASGDFNVQLDFGSQMKRNNQFSELINHFNHMTKQLKQMEEMRQEFISNVSHEIQSPLTSITGFAHALQSDQLTKRERKHYLQIIETESRRLSKLSDNLLKLTSLESDHHPFEKRAYRLDQQIRTILLACEPLWVEKELELDIGLENNVRIFADEDLMSQVWTNLIHNSIKFTPMKGKLSIQLQLTDGQAAISISDTGIGISEQDQLHIFERFFKADQARERTKSGSGLGLSIVKKIIDMHDGTIHVKSKLGKGTIFTVILPTGA
ncbi:sensor histidine kinase [Bacillus massiliglaciei]|uniref:sensor histidine kinase n=1 Tax=Bacillus massiliglaciei TaxID=1816693 RepID=UPI000A964DC1|nr:HAMP domain-containing sensor histidine kinase [Bacillus massiliglaciei]